MGSEKEIERRWIIQKLPNKELIKNSIRREVGYIFNEDGEMRLVKKYKSGETKHYVTIKTDGTLSRNEWQEKIPEWAFDVAWPQTYHNRLEITRHFIYWNRVLEIDEYHGRYEGLIKLEVEFDADDRSFHFPSNKVKEFQLPEWIGPSFEVTEDKRFNNKNLAGLITVQTKSILEDVKRAWK
jgi:CYTH domain-containing protein